MLHQAERGASFWLDVAEKELADAIADGEDLRELARLSEQVDKLKHMAKVKPTPDQVRAQTRDP
jgi:hypothetical protein